MLDENRDLKDACPKTTIQVVIQNRRTKSESAMHANAHLMQKLFSDDILKKLYEWQNQVSKYVHIHDELLTSSGKYLKTLLLRRSTATLAYWYQCNCVTTKCTPRGTRVRTCSKTIDIILFRLLCPMDGF